MKYKDEYWRYMIVTEKNKKRCFQSGTQYIFIFLLLLHFDSFSFTTSNTGIIYEMSDFEALSDSVSFNSASNLYDIICNITILDNDTLKLNPGETLKFYSTGLRIYGTLKAIGEEDNKIMIGDPDHSLYVWGERVDGIIFRQTSQFGESILKYCIINGVQRDWLDGFGGIICIDSSPIINHCEIKNIPRHDIETGGVVGFVCKGTSYPIISNTDFSYIQGIAVFCGTQGLFQDSENYPSPSMINCNIYSSVTGFYYDICDYDIVIFQGGFLDNCYLSGDMTLGSPMDTVGDGICNTTSTNSFRRYGYVDGVVNPASSPVTSIDEDDILPTTSKILQLDRNYPNPFNPVTTIEYSILKNTDVSLFIFNTKGETVKRILENKPHEKGNYSSGWDGKNDAGQAVSAGVYFIKLFNAEETMIKQAVLVK